MNPIEGKFLGFKNDHVFVIKYTSPTNETIIIPFVCDNDTILNKVDKFTLEQPISIRFMFALNKNNKLCLKVIYVQSLIEED